MIKFIIISAIIIFIVYKIRNYMIHLLFPQLKGENAKISDLTYCRSCKNFHLEGNQHCKKQKKDS
jgi:hypothetical protein